MRPQRNHTTVMPALSWLKTVLYTALFAVMVPTLSQAGEDKGLHNELGGLFVPLSRSELVIVPRDIAEVLVADPDIADVHVIGNKRVAFIGKKLGRTNTKLFDKDNQVMRQFDIIVGYDLPAIRKALHNFLPRERIGVELVNTNVALTGEVSDASVAEQAVRIVGEFVRATTTGAPAAQDPKAAATTTVLNLMKVKSGQQVMLRVRVGEIQRTALKNLGLSLSGFKLGSSGSGILGASNSAITVFDAGSAIGFGNILRPSGTTDFGYLAANLQNGDIGLSAALEALEQNGLLKTLAEPNLVAMSGEKAEFLAGGQFAVPVVQPGAAGSAPIETVQFQQFGVSVQFIPMVLSDNRIRLTVAPEVSQLDATNGTTANGATIPGLDTRRAKTTVELAPGESFMIAGLMQDNLNSSLRQIPGASEIPILGALLRSSAYQRNETELVIAVTPYIVDPLKSSEVRLPTDDFRPASVMEQFFYGALGAMSGNAYRLSQTPSLEGPIGYMTD